MTEIELKAAFAASLLRIANPLEAALTIVDDRGEALRMAFEWKDDPIVVREVARLREAGEVEALLATKADAAQLAWQMAKTLPEGKDRIAALKLFADMMEYTPKSGGGNNIQVDIVNKVMEVPRHSSDEEWEARAALQQERLLNVSDKRH